MSDVVRSTAPGREPTAGSASSARWPSERRPQRAHRAHAADPVDVHRRDGGPDDSPRLAAAHGARVAGSGADRDRGRTLSQRVAARPAPRRSSPTSR